MVFVGWGTMRSAMSIRLACSFALGAVALLGCKLNALAQQSSPPTFNQTYEGAFVQAREACKALGPIMFLIPFAAR